MGNFNFKLKYLRFKVIIPLILGIFSLVLVIIINNSLYRPHASNLVTDSKNIILTYSNDRGIFALTKDKTIKKLSSKSLPVTSLPQDLIPLDSYLTEYQNGSVLYFIDQSSEGNAIGTLYKLSSDKNLEEISKNIGISYNTSSDGNTLTYIVGSSFKQLQQDSVNFKSNKLYMKYKNNAPILISNNAEPYNTLLSSDGSTIIFTSADKNDGEITLYESLKGKKNLPIDQGFQINPLALSDDGKALLYEKSNKVDMTSGSYTSDLYIKLGNDKPQCICKDIKGFHVDAADFTIYYISKNNTLYCKPYSKKPFVYSYEVSSFSNLFNINICKDFSNISSSNISENFAYRKSNGDVFLKFKGKNDVKLGSFTDDYQLFFHDADFSNIIASKNIPNENYVSQSDDMLLQKQKNGQYKSSVSSSEENYASVYNWYCRGNENYYAVSNLIKNEVIGLSVLSLKDSSIKVIDSKSAIDKIVYWIDDNLIYRNKSSNTLYQCDLNSGKCEIIDTSVSSYCAYDNTIYYIKSNCLYSKKINYPSKFIDKNIIKFSLTMN